MFVAATMTMATATAPIVADTTTKMPTTTTMPAKTTQDTLQQVFCASKDSVTCGTDLDPICGSDTNFYLNKYTLDCSFGFPCCFYMIWLCDFRMAVCCVCCVSVSCMYSFFLSIYTIYVLF